MLATLAQFGYDASDAEVIERFVGRSAAAMAEAIERRLGMKLPRDWDKPFEHLYEQAFERQLAASPA